MPLLLLAVTPAIAAPQVSATKATDAPGVRKRVNDSIVYAVTISNSNDLGTTDATGVVLTDATPANTTAVEGSLRVTPIAIDDSYSVLGNTQRIVTAAQGVLANDYDPDAPAGFPDNGLTVKSGSATRVSGTLVGDLQLAPDGSFIYTPPAGAATGTERFSYIVVDAHNQEGLSVGYIKFSLSERVWYVQSGGTGDGRSHLPLGNPAVASAQANAATDTIYVLSSPGVLTGAFTLENNQKLLGQGVALQADLETNGITALTTVFPAASTPVVANPGGDAISLVAPAGTKTLGGLSIGDAARAIYGLGFGTVAIDGLSIATNGTALHLSDGALAGTGFTSIASSSTTSSNIVLSNISTVTTPFSLGTGSLSGSTGARFSISGGTGSFTYAGAISASGVSSPVLVVGAKTAGSLTFSGNISSSQGGSGIQIAPGNSAVGVHFTGVLSLSTGTGTAFNATSGTVSATNPGSTLATTTATALNVTNATIGAGGLIFRSISSNGALRGIVLNNTGTTGGLTVTGDGGGANNGSGGVIQNSSGIGISLTSTANASLNYLNVQNGADTGIKGVGLTNLALNRCNVTNNGNVAGEDGLRLGEATGLVNGVTGNVTLTNCSFTANAHNNVHIRNTSGTIASITVTGCSFSNLNDVYGANAFLIEAAGSSVVTTATISGCTFSGNSPQRALEVQGHDTATISGFTVSGNTFTDNGVHASFTQDTAASVTFKFLNNGSAGVPMTGSVLQAVNVFSSSQSTGGTIKGTISGNYIGSAGLALSGSAQGGGIKALVQGQTMAWLTIDGNVVHQTNGDARGISVAFRGSSSPLADGLAPNTVVSDVTLTNNAVLPGAAASGFPLAAIVVEADNQTGNDAKAPTVRADIRGNNVPISPVSDLADANLIFHEYAAVNGVGIAQLVDTAPASATAQEQLQSANTGSVSASTGVALISGLINQPPLLLAQPLRVSSDSPVGVMDTARRVPPTLPPGLVESIAVSPASRDDGRVSQSELEALVSAALARWEEAGLDAGQSERLRSLRFTVEDLPDWYLGQADGVRVRIDCNAGGRGWSTHADTAAGLSTDRVDLLTAILHEMGHALGLDDTYAAQDRDDVMYGWLSTGERRMPSNGRAAGVALPTGCSARFLTGPLNIGRLPAGKSVRVTFEVKIASNVSPAISSQGTVSGSNFASVLTDDPGVGGSADATVTAVQMPPSVAAITTNVDEDTALLFLPAMFDAGFADLNGDNVQVLRVVTLPAEGELRLGAMPVTALQEIPRASIGSLSFTPVEDFNGTVSFQWTASDGWDYATGTTTATINVAAVNDAPVAIVTPDSYNAIEQTALTLKGTGLSISDPDAESGSMTVTLAVGEGRLDASAGDSGAAVTNSGTSSVRLTGTVAQINALLGAGGTSALTFTAEKDDPAASTVLTLTVDDNGNTGGSAETASDTAIVNIAAVNDAPTAVITSDSYSATEQVELSLKNSGLAVSDPDAGSNAVTVEVSVGEGRLTATAGTSGASVANSGSSAVTLTGTIAQINVLLNSDGTSSVSYFNDSDAPATSTTLLLTIADGGNTGSGGALSASDTATINLTAANDAPVLAGIAATATYNENAAAVILSPTATVTDPDSATINGATVTIRAGGFAGDLLAADVTGTLISAGYDAANRVLTLSGADSLANYQAVLRSVSYLSSSENPTDSGATSARAIDWFVDDGATPDNLSATHTTALSVVAVNDAPTITVPAGLGGAPGVAVAVMGFTFADVDGGSSAYLATFSVSHGTLSASVSPGVSIGGTATELTLTATLVDLNAALAAGRLSYTSTNNDTLAVSLNDQGSSGGGAQTASAGVAISINQPPVLVASGGTTTFVEAANAAPVPVVVDSGITVTDVDSLTLASATVSISSGYQADEDRLAFANTGGVMGNVAASSFNATTGVLTLSSVGATATKAEWQAALRAVTYVNDSDTPDTATRTISFSVNDGYSNSVPVTTNLSVAATNDVPTGIDLQPATVKQSDGVGAAVGVLSATDPDDGGFTFTLVSGDGTNDAANGSFGVSGSTLTANDAGALASGPHRIRVQASDGHGGLIARSFTVTVTDDIRPAAPSTPDLADVSDTGASNTDGFTTDSTPTFTGTAEANSTVKLYESGTLLGTAVAAGGNWTITSSVLGTGEHAIKATATDAADNVSVDSALLTITIDATAPTVSTITRQTPATVNTDAASATWRVTFAEDVTGVDASDFDVAPSGLGSATGTVTSVTRVNAKTYDVAVAVSGMDGLQLNLKAEDTGIADLAGNVISSGFTAGDFYIVGVTSVFDLIATPSAPAPLTVSDLTTHRVAQRFTTSAGEPLTLTTVTAILGTVAAGTDPQVMLHASLTDGGIGAPIAELDDTGAMASGELYVWTSAQLLTPNTTYWLVFGATAGSYQVESTTDLGGVGSWLATADRFRREGDIANVANVAGPLQLAIGATSTPVITSSLTASGTYGAAFAGYTITATNTPTSFAAMGLPTGLSVNTATGVISGMPTQVGEFSVSLTGTNGSGTGPGATLVLTIAKAPLTVTANNASRYVGAANPTFTLSYAGFRNDDNAASLDTLPTAGTTATLASPIGTYPIFPSGGASTKYTFSYVAGTLTVSNEPPPSKSSQRIEFLPLAEAFVGQNVSLSATASSGLAVSFAVVSGPATLSGRTLTLTGVGVVTVRATQPGNGVYDAAPAVDCSFRVLIVPPPPVPPVAAGGTTSLSAGTTSPGATYQWQWNGTPVAEATSSSFTLTNLQPTNAGLYSYTLVAPDGTTTTSDPVVVGLTIADKVIGAAEEVLTDVVHPNGNIYDQLLLDGSAAALTANPRQITRISFIDLSDDIVQVEFSGAGTLSLVVDGVTVPAPPANYNQPAVEYVRGHAGIVITGANETSNVSVFSVGRANAVNRSLFRDGVAYDGVANVAFIAIQSTNGRFGGVYTGNVECFASQGFTGLYAPGVAFAGPVNLGDIQAYDDAQPVLVVGAASNVRIAGGTLAQPNGRPIQVDGLTHLTMAPGQTSQGNPLPAQPNQGVLQQHGLDVTDLVVAGP